MVLVSDLYGILELLLLFSSIKNFGTSNYFLEPLLPLMSYSFFKFIRCSKVKNGRDSNRVPFPGPKEVSMFHVFEDAIAPEESTKQGKKPAHEQS